MHYILLNAQPILLATLAGLLVSLAYHVGLGRSGGARWPVLAIAAPAQRWLCCILAGAVILAPTDQGAGPWTMALGSAIIIWVGFIAPALVLSYAYRAVRIRAALADAVAWLAIMLAQAAVLRGVGVAP